jgi:peroxiredoxin
MNYDSANVTLELGPPLSHSITNFLIRDHANKTHFLADLIGENGLMLGFISDVWNAISIQRILWLQRNFYSFKRQGVNMALVARDEPHLLYGFYVSSAMPPEFPLLADTDGRVHQALSMERFHGMVLLDHHLLVSRKWLVPDDRIWPKLHDILEDLPTVASAL